MEEKNKYNFINEFEEIDSKIKELNEEKKLLTEKKDKLISENYLFALEYDLNLIHNMYGITGNFKTTVPILNEINTVLFNAELRVEEKIREYQLKQDVNLIEEYRLKYSSEKDKKSVITSIEEELAEYKMEKDPDIASEYDFIGVLYNFYFLSPEEIIEKVEKDLAELKAE